MCTDWSKFFTFEGQKRFELVKKLAHLKHTEKALSDGETQWDELREGIVSYNRVTNDEKIKVVVNISADECFVCLTDNEEILLSSGSEKREDGIYLSRKGYIVIKKQILS